ncbi:MAG: tRNA-dihydrouridine synthase [Subdoligranulum sp.]
MPSRRSAKRSAFRCWQTAISPRRKAQSRFWEQTGCAGVMIGRGALGRPLAV